MKHNLKRPCADCPFRSDGKGVQLRPARVNEIHESLALRQESFPCHKTVNHGNRNRAEESQCAGAEIYLAHQHLSTQLSRITARLGLASDLDMAAPVVKSLREWHRVQGHEAEPDADGEHCSIAGPGCECPAGWAIGGGVAENPETIDTYCTECGQCVCDACSEQVEGQRVCSDCADPEALEIFYGTHD